MHAETTKIMTQSAAKSTPTFTPTFTLGFMPLTPQPNYRALHAQPLFKTQGFTRFTPTIIMGFIWLTRNHNIGSCDNPFNTHQGFCQVDPQPKSGFYTNLFIYTNPSIGFLQFKMTSINRVLYINPLLYTEHIN